MFDAIINTDVKLMCELCVSLHSEFCWALVYSQLALQIIPGAKMFVFVVVIVVTYTLLDGKLQKTSKCLNRSIV